MAELAVLSAGAVEGPVSELAPRFMQDTGVAVNLKFDTVGAIRRRLDGGEQADVVILSETALDQMERDGKTLAGTRTDLGVATCGVAVRDGMMTPSVDTMEAFIRMLRNAGSIAANDPAHGGSSGIYLASLLDKLGLTAEVAPKLVLTKTGRECALALLRGHAEIGITFTSEFLAVPGVRVVGPFPKEIEYVNGYAGAVVQDASKNAAGGFLRFLASVESRLRFQAYGLD